MAVLTLTPGGTSISRVDFNGTQDLSTVIFNNVIVYDRSASITCQVELTAAVLYDYYSEAATCGVDYYDYLGVYIQKLSITAYNYVRIKSLKLNNVYIRANGVITASGYGNFTNIDYNSSSHYSARNLTSGTKYTILSETSYSGDFPQGLISFLDVSNQRASTISSTSNLITIEITFQVTTDTGDVKYFTCGYYPDILGLPISVKGGSDYGVLSTNSKSLLLLNKNAYVTF